MRTLENEHAHVGNRTCGRRKPDMLEEENRTSWRKKTGQADAVNRTSSICKNLTTGVENNAINSIGKLDSNDCYRSTSFRLILVFAWTRFDSSLRSTDALVGLV